MLIYADADHDDGDDEEDENEEDDWDEEKDDEDADWWPLFGRNPSQMFSGETMDRQKTSHLSAAGSSPQALKWLTLFSYDK